MHYLFHFSLLLGALAVLLVGNALDGLVWAQWATMVLVTALLAVSWRTGIALHMGERPPSTNVGFYLYLLLGFAALIFEYYGKGVSPPGYLHVLVLTPLTVSAFISMVSRFGPVRTVQWVCWLVGGCWIGFAVLSNKPGLGMLISASPFVLMLLPAFLVKRLPRVTGGALVVLAAAAIVMFGGAWLRTSVWQFVLLGSLMPFPLLALGLMLLLMRRRIS